MPDELIIKHGDMARELCFAIKGTLVVRDSKGALVELLSGEGTAPCVTGTVSFFLGTLFNQYTPGCRGTALCPKHFFPGKSHLDAMNAVQAMS